MPDGNFWDTERDAFLSQCRKDGMTFSECQSAINQKFKVYYSRNACIGRAKRLGMAETAAEIRLRRSQVAVKREDTKRAKREAREQRLVRSQRRHKRGRNGITFGAAPVTEMDITGISARTTKGNPIPVGSFASRVVQTVKKINQDEAQAERRPRSPQSADTRPLRCAAVEPLHVALIDLKPESCRWPYGDGPITFCGHLVFGKFSYCPAHQRLSVGNGTWAERAAARAEA